MTTDQEPATWTEEELEVDDIRNTISESMDATMDMNGPHWVTVAQRVYDLHVAPLLLLVRQVERTRQAAVAEVTSLRAEVTSVESLFRQLTERANRQVREIDGLRAEVDHYRTHTNGNRP